MNNETMQGGGWGGFFGGLGGMEGKGEMLKLKCHLKIKQQEKGRNELNIYLI